MKSKGVAYLLWFFLGWLGIHRFYVGKIVTGLIWMFTFGLFGIGWFIDLFLLSGYVDMYNLLHGFGGRNVNPNTNQNANNNNVVVNLAMPPGQPGFPPNYNQSGMPYQQPGMPAQQQGPSYQQPGAPVQQPGMPSPTAGNASRSATPRR